MAKANEIRTIELTRCGRYLMDQPLPVEVEWDEVWWVAHARTDLEFGVGPILGVSEVSPEAAAGNCGETVARRFEEIMDDPTGYSSGWIRWALRFALTVRWPVDGGL